MFSNFEQNKAGHKPEMHFYADHQLFTTIVTYKDVMVCSKFQNIEYEQDVASTNGKISVVYIYTTTINKVMIIRYSKKLAKCY